MTVILLSQIAYSPFMSVVDTMLKITHDEMTTSLLAIIAPHMVRITEILHFRGCVYMTAVP